MSAYQLSVFAENKPGKLAKVTGILAKESINLRAITIATSDAFGVLNLLVDKPREAQKALEREGLTVKLKEVVAVVIEDRPGGLDKLIRALADENINVENAYGFVLESWKRAVFVVDVDAPDATEAVLTKRGYKVLDADELSAIEPFHYMKY